MVLCATSDTASDETGMPLLLLLLLLLLLVVVFRLSRAEK